ncbi:MAG: hypothetical protein WD991_01615, partial [Candidatus Paceibacterota bacterium]
REDVIEKTDIGGPTMIRSAAKGGRIAVCDITDREKVIEWLRGGEQNKEEFLSNLYAKAEAIISHYTAVSSEYHSKGGYKGISGESVLECSYGENAYQKPARLYKTNADPLALPNWQLVAGNPMSYNNLCDIDRMIQTVTHIGAGFEKIFNEVPFVAIGVKHGNACGASFAESAIEAVDGMLQGDLRAIFGGSVMLNYKVDEKIAEELIHKYVSDGRRLLDIVAAPAFTPEAIEILARKKGKCRILVNPNIEKAGVDSLDMAKRFRYVRGGFMEQPNYTFLPSIALAKEGVSEAVMQDVILAWAVGCTSNSNTVTIVKDGRLVGNGVGQQDRVGAAKLAIFRADDAAEFGREAQQKNSLAFLHPSGNSRDGTFRVENSSVAPLLQANLEGAVAYSDSFFPFPDAPEVLIGRGIKTIFSTSGSVNDDKIVELCKNKDVELILMPDKEARGFYQH